MAIDTWTRELGDIVTGCRLRKDVRRPDVESVIVILARIHPIAIIGVKSHRIQDGYIIRPRCIADGPCMIS